MIEMLFSLAIMLFLFTLMFGFGSKKNQMSKRVKCQGQLQKIYIGLQIYGNDHAGNFPVVPNAQSAEDALDVLVPQYVADTALFVCPGSKDRALPPGESLRKGRISYAYYMGRRTVDTSSVLLSDRQVDALAKEAGTPVFSGNGKKPANNHHKYGGNFLYGDGSVVASPALAAIALPLATNVVLLNPKP